MNARRLAVIGCGKRVLECALPALAPLAGRIELAGLWAREPRTVEAGEARHDVRSLAAAAADDFAGVDLIYVAVGKSAVPAVLARLQDLGLANAELLIETPVVRFRDFRAVKLVERFRAASVAEDCAYLPWFDVVAAARERFGAVRHVEFDRSAYAYHAVATARALVGGRVRSARRAGRAPASERALEFDGGATARVREPRDYAVGQTTIHFERAVGGERAEVNSAARIQPVVAGGEVRGFRLAEFETHLDTDEAALTRGDATDAGITARQAAMKRVGFLRIWRRLAAGERAHPLALGLEDMVVDYALERLGRYRATPLTRADAPLARTLFSALSRLGG